MSKQWLGEADRRSLVLSTIPGVNRIVLQVLALGVCLIIAIAASKDTGEKALCLLLLLISLHTAGDGLNASIAVRNMPDGPILETCAYRAIDTP